MASRQPKSARLPDGRSLTWIYESLIQGSGIEAVGLRLDGRLDGRPISDDELEALIEQHNNLG